MAWIIVCAGVIIAGFVLWDSLHEALPETLRLPRNGHLFSLDEQRRGPAAPVVNSSKWTVAADVANLRASREFLDPITAEGVYFYPPTLHVSCYNRQLYAWLDAGLRPAEANSKPGTAAVRLNGGPIEHWPIGEGLSLAAPEPARFVQALAAAPTISVTLAFEEAPEQTLRLSTDGLETFRARLDSCAAPQALR